MSRISILMMRSPKPAPKKRPAPVWVPSPEDSVVESEEQDRPLDALVEGGSGEPPVLTRSMLGSKTKAELVVFASELGIDLDPLSKKSDMVAKIAAAVLPE